MLTAEQKAERRNYIGASEAAAVLGLSRWSSPLKVWALKTGQIVEEDGDNLAAELGHELEDFVARRFCRKTGKKVELATETIYHPDHPFIACHLDRRVAGENAILQCKAVSAYKAREWDGEEIPREYIVQELHGLAVTNADRAYIAVLIGNHDFQMRTIERAEVLGAIEDTIRREVAFWNDFVLTNIMPMHITADDRDTLERLFPMAEPGPPVKLGDQANAVAEVLEAQNQDLKMLVTSVEKSKNTLLAFLGAHESGTTGIWDILWANTIVRRFDTEAFKKDHPTLYEKYRKPNTSRKFLIRKTNEEEE